MSPDTKTPDAQAPGARAADWPRPVVHWQIDARDPERLREFYGRMFNWRIGSGPIMEIPAGIGGPEPGPAGHLMPSERSGVTLYVQVRDLRESLARAAELGGTVVAEPFDLPNTPTLASITDPEGNAVMLVQA
ncbi:MAG TPA: VOC family protein [Acidimicrobiales bacterium]|nr:VOC family protein [Acidimicrobiales bacterium]